MMILLSVVIFSGFICTNGIHVPGDGEEVDKKTLTSLGIKTLGWQSESSERSSRVSVYHNYSKISLQNENVDSYIDQQPQKNVAKNDFSVKGRGKSTKTLVGPKSTNTWESQGNYLELARITKTETQNKQSYDQETSATNYQPTQYAPPVSYQHQHSSNAQGRIVNAGAAYTKCPEGATGQFIYQSSCQKFLNCWKGRGFAQNCSPGTLFNPQTLECDFASKVQCLQETYRSEEYHDFNAASIRTTGIDCPPEFSGVIPHKTDCAKFINCANGVQNVMDCPPGTLFSLKINNCDFPYNAECAGWSVQFGQSVEYEGEGSSVNQVYETRPSGYSKSEWENSQQTNQNFDLHLSNGYSQQNTLEGETGYYKGGNSNKVSENQNAYEAGHDHYSGSESSQKSWSNSETYGSGYQQSQFTGSNSNQNGYSHNTNGNTQVKSGAGSSHKYYSESGQTYNQQIQGSTPKCPQGAVGLLPHPTICAKFLNCANGQTFIQDCGPGTVFNPHTKVCDFPYNVECSDYSNIVDVRSEGKTNTNGDWSHKLDGGSYENNERIEGSSTNVHGTYVHGSAGQNGKAVWTDSSNSNNAKGFVTVNGNYGNQERVQGSSTNIHGTYIPVSPGLNGGYVPVPHDNGYGLSHNNVKGSTTVHENYGNNERIDSSNTNTHEIYVPVSSGHNGQYIPVPPNNGYVSSKNNNVKTSVTTREDYGNHEGSSTNIHERYVPVPLPDNQQAHTVNHQLRETVTCPEHPLGFYPHPTDCSKYFTCYSQKPTIYKCATGTFFNPIKKVCDIPRNVQCYTGNTHIYNHYSGSESSNHNQETHQINQSENKHNTQNVYENSQGSTNGFTKYDSSKTVSKTLESRGKFKDSCEARDFHCSADLCIPRSMECDGSKDCPNGLDEQNCNKYMDKFILKENSVLAIREKERFSHLSLVECAKSCLQSKGFECKSFSYRTDAECFLSDSNVGSCGALITAEPYSYYELADLTVDCTNLYKCPNDKCINETQVCDGVNDCGDRSDEKGCTAQSLGYEIRLGGSTNKYEGRIEMRAFGKWGYVCDDRFGMRDADVVCHELGFPLGALEIKGNSYFAKDVDIDNVLYLMDDVVCLGNETTIRDCDFNGWGVSNCEPQEIVGVVCKTPVEKCPKDHFKCETVQDCVPLAFVCDNVFDCPDQSDEATRNCETPSEIRLVHGKTEREGRVEIRHHGMWGTVCDDDFNDDAAKVVCNSLGYPGKATVKKEGYFGEGDGPIWLDQVFCQGNESLLQECSHWNWGEHNCEHAEDVGVVCSSSGTASKTVETDSRSNINAPSNIVEVPPTTTELFPSECGLRKNSEFYVDEVHFRVVQGSVAKKGFYPWQASLRIKNNAKPSHWCGAVVISRKFVLTAAHCFLGFSKGSYVVIAGDYNTDETEGTEQEAYIEEFYVHEEFRHGQKMNNDIALVELKGNGFIFTKDVQPICLPESDVSYTNQLNCTISGFGTVQTGKSGPSHDLRAGWVPIQPPEVCKMPHVYGSAITDGMFCAGALDEGVDACEGDSGGPLACLHNGVFTLYGITSWGQHCGHANKPGVYVKVAYYRDWIEKTMKKDTV